MQAKWPTVEDFLTLFFFHTGPSSQWSPEVPTGFRSTVAPEPACREHGLSGESLGGTWEAVSLSPLPLLTLLLTP